MLMYVDTNFLSNMQRKKLLIKSERRSIYTHNLKFHQFLYLDTVVVFRSDIKISRFGIQKTEKAHSNY